MNEPQYVRDQTGKLRRVVYVERGTAPAPPPPVRYQPPAVYAPPHPYYAAAPRRLGCSPLLLLLLALLGIVFGLIALIPGVLRPHSPIGKMSDGLADTLAAGGLGLRTFTVAMVSESPADLPAPPPPAEATVPQAADATPDADLSLVAPPSITPAQIDAILASYGSPAEGTGADWWLAGDGTGIDPAFAVAFFVMESTAGTNPAWAGWKADGTTTHNVGNIICAGYATCYGRFRDYPSWRDGIADWFKLIRLEYVDGREIATLGEIVPLYAPAIENDVQAYIATVAKLVRQWRAEEQAGPRAAIVAYALSRQGDPYVSGARREGASDCSGFTQLVYKTVAGIDIGATTFSQWPGLDHIDLDEVQPGDLWYGRWDDSGAPDSEHTGIVADVDGDGAWDLIHNGSDVASVHVTYAFLDTYLGARTLGFARAISQ